MGDFFIGAGVGAFLTAMAAVFLYVVRGPNYPKDCDTLGAFWLERYEVFDLYFESRGDWPGRWQENARKLLDVRY